MGALDLDGEMHAAFLESTRLVASVLEDGACERLGEWFVYDAAVDNPDFNIAAVAGDAAIAATQLRELEAWYRRRAASASLKLRPVHDAAVFERLGPEYIESPRREPYMAFDLRAPIPEGAAAMEAERVTDDAGVAAYDSFDAARGRPPEWSVARAVLMQPQQSLFVGRAEGRVVARAWVVTTLPVASIHNVVVVEEARRRGFGTAITAAALRTARAAGCSFASLGSSEVGYPLYLSMGFEHRYELATFREMAS